MIMLRKVAEGGKIHRLYDKLENEFALCKCVN